jgi:predicted DNA binding CopG/RHH family protein
VGTIKKEYDFSKAKRNPYAKLLKKQITIRLDSKTIEYFKALSNETGIPYQNLINLYLRNCAAENKKLSLHWDAKS